MIIYNNKIFKKMISNDKILDRIHIISEEINNHYKDKSLVLICVLNGSLMVFNELIKQLTIDFEIDYIEVSSYEGGTKSKGKINIIKNIQSDLTNKNVLIVEDIVDSGNTLNYIYNLIRSKNASDVKVFSLLYKSIKYNYDVKIDWFGFEINDIFTIGYGMDYEYKFRGLKDIYGIL